MPPAISISLAYPLYNLYAFFIPSAAVRYCVGAGTVFGYICYDMMHCEYGDVWCWFCFGWLVVLVVAFAHSHLTISFCCRGFFFLEIFVLFYLVALTIFGLIVRSSSWKFFVFLLF